jgi:hypothetical protein
VNHRPTGRVVPAAGPYPELIALFTAMERCSTVCTLPHPVGARKSGVVAAWRVIESEFGEQTKPLMNVARRTFLENVDLLRNIVIREPVWAEPCRDRNTEKARYILPTAPLMFWSGRHAIIETTDALEQILVHSDLGDDLRADMLRPLFPASYVRFGKTFREAVLPEPTSPSPETTFVQGVYVFETVRETRRLLTLAPIFTMAGAPAFFVSTIDIFIDDEGQSLSQNIRDTCERNDLCQAAHFESIAQIVAKVFLYMSLPQTVRIEEHDYTTMHERLKRIGPKKAAKLQRQLPDLYDRIVLGPQEIHVHGHGEVSPHLRRGHFTMQPHGPRNSLRKLMFIAPTWIRADKLAASA